MMRTKRVFLSISRERGRESERAEESGSELARVQLEKLSDRCLNSLSLSLALSDRRFHFHLWPITDDKLEFVQLGPCEISTILGAAGWLNLANWTAYPTLPPLATCCLRPLPQQAAHAAARQAQVCPCLATTTQIVGVGDTASEREREREAQSERAMR